MAAQSGISGQLMDPLDGSVRTARQAIDTMVDFVADDLEARGDLQTVQAAIEGLFLRGTGASAQREAYRRNQSTRDVTAAMSLT